MKNKIYATAARLERATDKAFSKFPTGKKLERAEALAHRARAARREAQAVYFAEHPPTILPYYVDGPNREGLNRITI